MDYPFVHRGLLRDDVSRATTEALKTKLVGRYVRQSGRDPLKIVDVEKHHVEHDKTIAIYRFTLMCRNKERVQIDIYQHNNSCGTFELTDDPINPW